MAAQNESPFLMLVTDITALLFSNSGVGHGPLEGSLKPGWPATSAELLFARAVPVRFRSHSRFSSRSVRAAARAAASCAWQQLHSTEV